MNFDFSAKFSLINEEDDENEKENDETIRRIRNLISLTDDYNYSKTKTWSELLEISEKAKKGIENEIEKLISFIKNELIGKVLKDNENIVHNQLQIDYLNNQIASLDDAKKAIKTATPYTSIHYLFKPAIFLSKTN